MPSYDRCELESLAPSGVSGMTASGSGEGSDSEEKLRKSNNTSIPKLELTNCLDDEVHETEDSCLTNNNKRHSVCSNQHQPKFSWIWRYLSLRGVFHLLGQSIALCPWAYIVTSILIASFSCGMYFMVLKDRIRDGYTPNNAPSRYETDVMREFWNSSGDPIMTIFMTLARDNGSMLRPDYLTEAVSLHNYLLNNFTIRYNEKDMRYKDLCAPYCNMNLVLDLFKSGFDQQIESLYQGQPLSESINLTYPVSNVDGFTVHLDRSFFGIRIKNISDTKKYIGKNFTYGQDIDGMGPETIITNIEFVKVIMMIFRGDRTTKDKGDVLALWELAAYDFFMNEYKNELVETLVIGTEILDQEMIKDGQRLTPYFAAGFGFMIAFVTITVLGSALFYDEVDAGKFLVAAGATFCPIIAITTTYGLISLCGMRTNSFMLVMPFLIMGIGVDDAFLMIHSWQRLAPRGYPISLRLGMVFEEVGPSITITSLTNFISFGIGALTPTPEIRLFCLATAIAMGLDYIFELILFGPILALATKCEKPKKARKNSKEEIFNTGWRKTVDSISKFILKLYCKIIGHRVFTIVLIIATGAYLYFSIIGVLNIKTRLDSVKILPRDSAIQKPNLILDTIIWGEYHPVTILINKPFDIKDKQQYSLFYKMLYEFESLPRCKGKESTMLWLRDYEHYYKEGDILDGLLSFFGYSSQQEKTETDDNTKIDFTKIDDFLESPFYKHWKAVLKLGEKNSKTGEREVIGFWFTASYHNTSAWESRIELMIKWREIAARYSTLNVTVWEANAMFVDQMLSLKNVALQTGLLTLVCMAVVCAIFIPNPCSVLTASLAIASISLGVLGFLSWWHLDLDPVTMAAVLMSIGLSVDFTAHVSYHYQLLNRKEVRNGKIVKIKLVGSQEKLVHTLENVGWPMIQAGLSTVMCILPLAFLQSYAPTVFVKTIVLVVAWGLLHGLLVLPGFLGALPDFLTNANCYRTFFSTSSQKSCRYAGPPNDEQEMNIVT